MYRRRVKQFRQGWRPFRREPFPAGREHPLGFSPCGVSGNEGTGRWAGAALRELAIRHTGGFALERQDSGSPFWCHNAVLDLARARWNCAPPSYQIVESRPPLRTGIFWFFAILGALTTVSFAAIIMAGPGRVWDPADPLSTILVASDALVAFVAWFFVVNLARMTGSNHHLFIITRWSFLFAIIDMPAEFRFRQYYAIGPSAQPGTLRLVPAASGRERTYRVGNLFPNRPQIAARVVGAFSWFQA